MPALHVLVGPMLEFAEPDETGYLPTPYELGGPGEFVAFLEESGFRDAREERVARTMRFKDEEEYFEVMLRSTPLGHSLSEEEPDVQERIQMRTRENLRNRKTDGGIFLPAECVIVTARK